MLAFGNVPLPRGKLESYAPRTITDPAALGDEIAGTQAETLAAFVTPTRAVRQRRIR